MSFICHYQWDAVENKSTVLLYGGGGLVAVWLSSILVGAINSVPLVSYITRFFKFTYYAFWTNLRQFYFRFQLPKIMELVGLGYTGWFVYRYLLFKVGQIHKHSPLCYCFRNLHICISASGKWEIEEILKIVNEFNDRSYKNVCELSCIGYPLFSIRIKSIVFFLLLIHMP